LPDGMVLFSCCVLPFASCCSSKLPSTFKFFLLDCFPQAPATVKKFTKIYYEKNKLNLWAPFLFFLSFLNLC
jgi:hypothetical protein